MTLTFEHGADRVTTNQQDTIFRAKMV